VFTLKQKIVIIKKVKIMSKSIKAKEDKDWSISLGFYPGMLLGMRTYYGEESTQHVIYLPFIDLAIEIEN
jgi:hypothetical protein